MDDMMKRSREWLQSCVNAATRSGVPEEADLEAFLLAHLDDEHARGVAEERARVVTLLTKAAQELEVRPSERHDLSSERLRWAAERIERGEHVKEDAHE